MIFLAQGFKCRVLNRAIVEWSGGIEPSRRYMKRVSHLQTSSISREEYSRFILA